MREFLLTTQQASVRSQTVRI